MKGAIKVIIPIQGIYDMTEELKKTYDERDLNKLAKQLGILVDYFSMGYGQTSCKGFFMQAFDVKHISINSDLTLIEQYIIFAHEFGHAMQNQKAVVRYDDWAILDSTNEMEINANYFAADWIMADEDVMDLVMSGMTFFQIAAMLNVLPELLAYKYHSMGRRGYEGMNSPVDVRSRYLSEYKPLAKMAEDYIDD